MAVIGVQGSSSSVNTRLLKHAVTNPPTLVIDCANAANVFASIASLENAVVIEVELLHTFRDVLRRVYLSQRSGIRTIVITRFDHLFHYQNDEENRSIFEHVWELIERIGYTTDVIVGIPDGKFHRDLARQHCTILKEITAHTPQFSFSWSSRQPSKKSSTKNT